MRTLPCSVDLDALAACVSGLQYTQDSTGIEMSHPQAKGKPGWLGRFPILQDAVADLEAQTRAAKAVMVNRLGPGVRVPLHKDAEGGERWHLPIVTNPRAYWWDARDADVHMEAGKWWGPVPWEVNHSVSNLGDTPRIHLIVDLED